MPLALFRYVKRLLLDAGGLRLLLAAVGAHVAHEDVVTQLLLALRSLLPASHPRELVEGGGLELLAECLFVLWHVDNAILVAPPLAALAAWCWLSLPPAALCSRDEPPSRPRGGGSGGREWPEGVGGGGAVRP
jgi:hypothetical protein